MTVDVGYPVTMPLVENLFVSMARLIMDEWMNPNVDAAVGPGAGAGAGPGAGADAGADADAGAAVGAGAGDGPGAAVVLAGLQLQQQWWSKYRFGEPLM